MSNDNEDFRSEVALLRDQMTELQQQISALVDIVRVADNSLAKFFPPLRAELISDLQTIYREEERPDAEVRGALFRAIFDDLEAS